ncbi:MAG: histone deacetylase [Candidatus Aminicenantes bacterium]|nr:MAG: histone deacetylase [Candidatus Aminicenantes bacterium]
MFLRHDAGMGHPESHNRLIAINDAVKEADWYQDLKLLKARPVDMDILSLAHDPGYIRLAERECKSGYRMLSTGDTNVCEESFEIALHAVGGVLAAVDAVFEKKAKNAFCAVRPPGHHATRNRGMGFCLFNNIAAAARYAQKKYNVQRVLIADWDVHHGNGTNDIFYHDDTVFYMSTHQFPWYPGTGRHDEIGAGKGKGFTMNRPFPAGAGNEEIIPAFKDELLPAAKDFKPDFALISAGFDSHARDFLGGFRIDDHGFRELTKIMMEIADIAGEGRLVSILEGGYNLESMASAVVAHMDELSKI